eukprot:c14908_g1_i1.p1 GENE.c14908_g1_i1~~c14908_g1_i1.p1  ORF type:complete len:842 (-),score=199.15 c14908_g1_i1:44-2569(-)
MGAKTIPATSQYRHVSTGQNTLGALTLIALTAISIHASVTLFNQAPCYTVYPFGFSIIGGGIGMFVEAFGTSLDLAFKAKAIRGANVGLVFAANTVLVLSLSTMDSPTNTAYFLTAAGFVGGFTWWNGFLGHEFLVQTGALLTILVSLFVIVTAFPKPQLTASVGDLFGFEATARSWLQGFQAVNFVGVIALAVFARSPLGSPVFHALVSLAALSGFAGLEALSFDAKDTCRASFASFKFSDYHNSLFCLFIGGALGLASVVALFPLQKGELRFMLVGSVWKVVHTQLLFGVGPNPQPLSTKGAVTIKFSEYELQHKHANGIFVPAANSIPVTQTYKQFILGIVFSILSVLDRVIPTARSVLMPKEKPRVETLNPLNPNDTEYWVGPEVYWPVKSRDFVETPVENCVDYSRSQLLPYIIQYSHGFRNLRKIQLEELPTLGVQQPLANATHILDMSFLARYHPKDGFFAYGGKAIFSATEKSVELLALQGPENPHWFLAAEFGTPQFRIAEKGLHASTVFANVVLHHLLEIHTATSVVSAAMNNAFDVSVPDLPSAHPFRQAMQFHFYNSTQVQEVTTAHLLDKTGIFSQVFGLRHEELATALNEHWASDRVWFAQDSNIEARQQILVTPQSTWEAEYYDIFLKYASAVVDSIWKTDQLVAQDARMKAFHKEMTSNIDFTSAGRTPLKRLRLAERHGRLDTKQSVAYFMADAIHHVTVRHEYLGTKVALNALDHRFSGLGAVVRDGLPSPKEDYQSLMLITAATAMKPAAKLQDPNQATVFRNLLAETSNLAQRNSVVTAFDRMQTSLKDLEDRWTRTPQDRHHNRVNLRVLPSDLELGATY